MSFRLRDRESFGTRIELSPCRTTVGRSHDLISQGRRGYRQDAFGAIQAARLQYGYADEVSVDPEAAVEQGKHYSGVHSNKMIGGFIATRNGLE